MPQQLTDREQGKFRDTGDITKTRVGVDIEQSIPLPVYLTQSTGSTRVVQYSEVSVATGIETTILSYTVPLSKTLNINSINLSGENIGEYIIYLNGTNVLKTRTMFGSDLSKDISFKITLNASEFIDIKVINPRTSIGDYCASIIGELL